MTAPAYRLEDSAPAPTTAPDDPLATPPADPSGFPVLQLLKPEPAPPRYGPGSKECPRCHWLLPQPPYDPVCTRCADREASLPPMSTREKLYLAMRLVRSEWDPTQSERAWWDRLMYRLYVTSPLDADGCTPGTPTAVLRERLAKDADGWFAAKCPI